IGCHGAGFHLQSAGGEAKTTTMEADLLLKAHALAMPDSAVLKTFPNAAAEPAARPKAGR
ncbi:MAG: hypothetical protein ACREVJ_14715, partial [Gammaproteobacteria bacterium]